MRFPLLLSAKLAKARAARIWQTEFSNPPMEFADPSEFLHLGSAHPVSHEKMQAMIASPAPAVWVGGSEPLDHPGIAHFLRAIAHSGHFVFLETAGTLLRRRIHEFQPLPHVFLTVRLDAPRSAAPELAVEGIRAARLSGFFTAIHSRVREDSDIRELHRLREFISELHVDGWLITAATGGDALARKAAEARVLIPSSQWRRFSRLVERVLLSRAKTNELRQDSLAEKPLRETCEEGVNVA
jgi:hypothetical protein